MNTKERIEKLDARLMELHIEKIATAVEDCTQTYDEPARTVFLNHDEAICIAVCQYCCLSFRQTVEVLRLLSGWEFEAKQDMTIAEAAREIAEQIRTPGASLNEWAREIVAEEIK